MDEKELRKKIRQELIANHKQNHTQKPGQEHGFGKDSADHVHEDFIGDAIIHALEYEICAKYPDMIECENHLGEIRWFTPLELSNEYEYYPVRESFWDKVKNKIFGFKPYQVPQDPKWQAFAEEQRSRIEEDVKRRINHFREKQGELQKKHQTEIEKKIYQEEIDKFYRAKKGYKKYKNHLGEYRWMTREEAENQDEFFEPELSPRQKLLVRLGVLVIIILSATLIWQLGFLSKGNGERAYLVVEFNDERANVYIGENLAVGIKPQIPYPIPPGVHDISIIRSGYMPIPKVQQINAAVNDTVRVTFRLEKQVADQLGYVRIQTGGVDGSVYVNGEFYGNLAEENLIALEAGRHTIKVSRSGYMVSPPERFVDIRANDTLSIRYELKTLRDTRTVMSPSESSASGLIEVRSNVKNANIYVNGQKTDFKTDYVLQKLPYGSYRIAVRREGYSVSPKEQIITISRDSIRALASFTLSSTTTEVLVQTVPVEGDIFIDGRWAGKGSFEGSMALGEHWISFGTVPYYIQPDSQKITFTADKTNEFAFRYTINYRIQFTADQIIPDDHQGNIITGHILRNPAMIVDPANGPGKKFSSAINGVVWYLGYTFPYRNPAGSDAIGLEFNIPEHIDLSQPIRLKLWIYRTRSNYPLVVRGNSYYQILINGNTFRAQVLPQHGEDDMAENNYDVFVVNDYLRPGKNSILLSTIDNTTAEVALWKVALE